MKKSLFALMIFGACFTANAQNHGGMLTGDTKLACEAILCLSTGQRPNGCAPSIQRYFSISRKKWSDTVKDRRKFLNKCPSVNEDNTMRQLANAISEGAEKCNVPSPNKGIFASPLPYPSPVIQHQGAGSGTVFGKGRPVQISGPDSATSLRGAQNVLLQKSPVHVQIDTRILLRKSPAHVQTDNKNTPHMTPRTPTPKP
ncbi:MAG: hypothetical protein LBE22_00570 [Azoarcus sp.]|jgi:hypothetical protein|nr:hypothetical protein [Azoarcus sp.]